MYAYYIHIIYNMHLYKIYAYVHMYNIKYHSHYSYNYKYPLNAYYRLLDNQYQ